jgi:asparagine synthase (glutamine-hydrolysing)
MPSRLRRHAAAHGLAVRSPLLDHRLAEFAVRLPVDQTFRAGQRKIILRNAMRGVLPDAVVDMWGKIVPTVIADRGLREREQEKVRGYMRNMRAADLGYVDEAPLRQAYDDYVVGKTDSTMFWFAITLEDWLRRYF